MHRLDASLTEIRGKGSKAKEKVAAEFAERLASEGPCLLVPSRVRQLKAKVGVLED
jgi:hypothetical protein